MNYRDCVLRAILLGGSVGGLLTAPGCTDPQPSRPANAAFGRRPVSAGPAATQAAGRHRTASAAAVAYANGRPIAADRLDRILRKTYGLSVLQQLIMIELVKQAAVAEGLDVDEQDIDAELDEALKLITTDPTADDQTRRALLDNVLKGRGMSMDQFMLGMEQNAYLRKLARKQLTVTEQDLRNAFELSYGERVRIRHIECNSLRAASVVRQKLDQGQDFAALARQHSDNKASAAHGGLLGPMSLRNPSLPKVLREVVAGLDVGQVAPAAVRWNDKYHLVQLAERIGAQNVAFEDVRDDLERRVRREALRDRMQQIRQRIAADANIRILDPVLKEQFERLRQTPTARPAP